MARIMLYKCVSENIVINKQFDGEPLILAGTFRDGINVIEPKVIIESVDEIYKYNYCFIEKFNRYYYISNITILRNNVYELSCKCDVLYTYRAEIFNLKGVVLRQENSYNLYLNDNNFKVKNYPRIQTIGFPNGFSKDLKFVLTTSGGGE